ncbi:CheY-P phosphatase CheC [Legionella beliardensis]|uniref:CheY-P phosphatase CheC n=1 Tax=Legionella beliardensis TaxID=91822 RepID=A0A378I5L5_9GAMM|nr:chemotaxis protein CheC [Legionella beliardensis]STX29951.1 CheY-P phosphatase CheC [Legionella beliardensis]
MILTASQEDALKEIGNIGVSKAAKQLSLLLQSPIKISIPQISFVKLQEIGDFGQKDETFSFVYQLLSEDLQGYVALALKREQTNLLTMSVLGKIPQLTQEEARACEQEALLEIGNIIISSCITTIVDLMAKKVGVTLPHYDENNIVTLLKHLSASFPNPLEKVLIVSTILDMQKDTISGNLFLILTNDSTQTILMAIKELINEND